MFSGTRHYRIGYILLAVALVGVGALYILDAHNAQAAELPAMQNVLECTSCHSNAPRITSQAAFPTDPCDACHDEAPRPDRVISPEQVGRDLVTLESHFAAFWDNPLQKLDIRYSMAVDQLWQAKNLVMIAERQSDFIALQDLITQVEASLSQLENEAQWGYWRSLETYEAPGEAITYAAPFPIPIVAHGVGDSLVYLKPPDGQHLELAGLLVLSLCVLLIALRRAPPSEHHNDILNTNLPFRRRVSGHDRSPFLFALFMTNSPSHEVKLMKCKEVAPAKII